MAAHYLESLIEQLDSNEVSVFVDSCAETGNQFRETQISPNKNLTQFDEETMKIQLSDLNTLAHWYQEHKIIATPGLIEEAEQYQQILQIHQKKFQNKHAYKRRFNKFPPGYERIEFELLELFRDIVFEQKKAIGKMAINHKQNQYLYGTVEYQEIYCKVLEIGRKPGIKQNKYGPVNHKNKTDEELVATALYQSMIKEKSSHIFSEDTDIKRILDTAQQYYKQCKPIFLHSVKHKGVTSIQRISYFLRKRVS